MTSKLLFTEKSLPLILEAFGNTLNNEGFIVNKITGKPILTPNGQKIEAHNFLGMKKGENGSSIYFKNLE